MTTMTRRPLDEGFGSALSLTILLGGEKGKDQTEVGRVHTNPELTLAEEAAAQIAVLEKAGRETEKPGQAQIFGERSPHICSHCRHIGPLS